MAEALRVFALDYPLIARTLKERLQQRRAELAGQLAAGVAEDWGDYKHRVGIIEGLRQAIGICDEIEQDERN